MTSMSVGVKGFFTKSRAAPYGFLRAGFMHVYFPSLFGDEATNEINGTAHAGAGIEFSGFSGFNFFLELGPTLLYSGDFEQFLWKGTLGLGYRYLT